MAGFHGLNIYINGFNKPQKTPFMGKRSIHIINKITLGLFLRLLIEQDGILLVQDNILSDDTFFYIGN